MLIICVTNVCLCVPYIVSKYKWPYSPTEFQKEILQQMACFEEQQLQIREMLQSMTGDKQSFLANPTHPMPSPTVHPRSI